MFTTQIIPIAPIELFIRPAGHGRAMNQNFQRPFAVNDRLAFRSADARPVHGRGGLRERADRAFRF
jgi:hypothetical protein